MNLQSSTDAFRLQFLQRFFLFFFPDVKRLQLWDMTPNAQDIFPCLEILPSLDGCTALVLKNWRSLWFDLLSTKGNLLYRTCVIAFNETYFERKVDAQKKKG